jgi:signal transduction histidine kinase
MLSVAMPMAAIIVLFLPRINNPDRFQYYLSPGIISVLLATSVVPVLVFSKKERILMIACQGINFIFFASADILLRFFSVKHELPSIEQYFAANLSLLMSYLLLTGSVLSLKAIINEYEKANEELVKGLNQKNDLLEKNNIELHQLNNNITAQNEEIQSQSEELLQSQESLTLANTEIERQKAELEKSLDEKSFDLLATNQQLVIQNNDLQQFSYTVSHNLRGPVASILGLINIHRLAETKEERESILSLLEGSALSLENVIIDLNKIIDIRFDKFGSYEEVPIESELSLIRQSLHSFLEKNNALMETDFQYPVIRSIKSYINSILYNLISNALQYRSPMRVPVIRISSSLENDYAVLKVSDNGLGIDLNRFRNDLFRLYKRFHISIPGGRGLGLYLVKQQVEKLNGRIDVESIPDEGTTFTVYLPIRN